jgi:hypothetical protein
MTRSCDLMRRAAVAVGIAAALASAASAATVTRIENGRPGTATFLFEGSIVAGDVQRMTKALEKLPIGTSVSVILESPGGLVSEGLQLGTVFHRAKITTVVKGDGAICYSACALAFLGGRDLRTGLPARIKMSGGKLGFHQFRRTYDPLKVYTKADYEAEVARAQVTTGLIVTYLKQIGEDLSKLQLMLRAPSESMNVISNEESLKRGFHVLDEATGRLSDGGQPSPHRLTSVH